MAEGSYREGGIYLLPDAKVRFTPQGVAHPERRPFLILSRDLDNLRPDWEVVFGCPVSSQSSWTTQHDLKMPAGTANLPKKSWARIPMAQSVLKTDLEDYWGCIPSEMLLNARALLARYVGLA